ALYVSGDIAAVAHVGDSRVYRLREGTLTPLTRDHSLWAELVAAGQAVAPRHQFPYRNQITRALGLAGDARADTTVVDVQPGDRFLLCSDGLYDPFDDPTLALHLATGDAARCCEALVALAYERGSTDNITAVIVDAS
ncbi:MAG: serine/threonine-protein phosphatase, partial [Myxococcaceae bacterium]|nr:serine/threonine-protein phosphatase [Myxococcaceae bacterium]